MRLALARRLATPFIAAGAAMTLMLGGAGVAAAQETPLPPAWSGDKSADNLRWSLSLSAVNGNGVDRDQSGVNVVHPGDTVTYTAKIWKSSGIGRYITGIRQIQPAGFQYQSHTVSKQSTVTDEGAAGVKAVCAGGGCSSVPILGNKGYLDSVDFAVTYKIPTSQAFGDYNAGFEFDVYSFSTRQGANPAGAWVRVVDSKATTTTAVQAPPTAQTGTPVTLTANVGPATSVGTVQFKDGGTDIGAPATVSGGVATLSHTFATPGAHAITAAFTGGAGFHDSVSAATNVDVTAVTTTTLTAPATATVGQDVTFTAGVAPATATGQVQFKDGGTNLGAPVTVVNGQATLTRSFAEAGSHNVTANFVGTGGYTDSASAGSALTVTDADFGTTTTVLEPLTATTGTPVNLSATVLPIPGGGNVEFLVDGVSVGTAPVGTGDGVAILQHTFTSAGTPSVVAKFTGTTGFTASTSGAFDVTVKAPDTRQSSTTTLGVTGDAVVGKTMTFTASVAPAAATGTVQFKIGTELVGAPVAVVNGVATVTHTFDAVGTHGITAVYSGDNGHKESVSGPTVVNITAAGNPGTPGGSGSADFGSLSNIFGS